MKTSRLWPNTNLPRAMGGSTRLNTILRLQAHERIPVIVPPQAYLPPSINIISDLALQEDSNITLVLQTAGSLPLISYLWEELGSNYIDTNTVTMTDPYLSFRTPHVINAGDTVYIEMRVTVIDDSGTSVVEDFQLSVRDHLVGPTVTGRSNDGPHDTNDIVDLIGTADDDIAIDYVQWSILNDPKGIAIISGMHENASFVVPYMTDDYLLKVQFKATDVHGLSATTTFDILLNKKYVEPRVHAIMHFQPTNTPKVIHFTPIITVGPGDSLKYAIWSFGDAPNATGIDPTVTFAHEGVQSVHLYLETEFGAKYIIDTTIEVEQVNPPNITADADGEIYPPQNRVLLQATADDGEGNPPTRTEWSVVDGEGINIRYSENLVANFTTPYLTEPTEFTLRFSAWDSYNQMTSEDVTITVLKDNYPHYELLPNPDFLYDDGNSFPETVRCTTHVEEGDGLMYVVAKSGKDPRLEYKIPVIKNRKYELTLTGQAMSNFKSRVDNFKGVKFGMGDHLIPADMTGYTFVFVVDADFLQFDIKVYNDQEGDVGDFLVFERVGLREVP